MWIYASNRFLSRIASPAANTRFIGSFPKKENTHYLTYATKIGVVTDTGIDTNDKILEQKRDGRGFGRPASYECLTAKICGSAKPA
ncbi:hypothetical protein RHECNPAF_9300127 [Rhizobium etli CNPAF512]|nr:hypothetical protein RHECNPAF_9300127 [Rhizobium etli CNPAF512]